MCRSAQSVMALAAGSSLTAAIFMVACYRSGLGASPQVAAPRTLQAGALELVDGSGRVVGKLTATDKGPPSGSVR
jgi:hypothetical protein